MEDEWLMVHRGLVHGIREALLEAEAIFEAQRKVPSVYRENIDVSVPSILE